MPDQCGSKIHVPAIECSDGLNVLADSDATTAFDALTAVADQCGGAVVNLAGQAFALVAHLPNPHLAGIS